MEFMNKGKVRRSGPEDDDDFSPSSPILINRDQSISNTYTVFFDRVLDNPQDYSGLLQLLASAQEEDIFILRFIGCPGGSISIALPLYNAIQNTSAQTVSVLESHSSSAATMLLLACQRVVVQPGSSMMIHGASYGSFGHMSHVKSTVEFSETYLRSIFNRVYKGFLAEEEIEKLLTTDYDLNFTDQQIIERLTKMTEPAEDVVQETKPAPKGRAKPKKETK